jgi:hypothetical protein
LQVTSPVGLIAVVPHLLGFAPWASLVVIGVSQRRGWVRLVFRYDVPDPPETERAIERKHHVGRRTIVRALASADPSGRRKIHREPSALDGLQGHIAMIESDSEIATAIRQRLADDSCGGSDRRRCCRYTPSVAAQPVRHQARSTQTSQRQRRHSPSTDPTFTKANISLKIAHPGQSLPSGNVC